jgi:putative DNA primase/helicase
MTHDLAAENNRLDAAAIDGDVVAELARLSPLEYDRARGAAADRLGVRVASLDRLVNAKRPAKEEKGQGRALDLPDPEPWPESVNGAAMLSEIVSAVTSHVVMAKASADAFGLWAVHTYAVDAFPITPRLAIMSPEKQCGKTTLLDVLACLVRRPLPTANASMSGIFRAVEMVQPTLLLDEADRFVTNQNEELLGILNSGHRKGGSVLRTVGDDHEPRMFSTFAPCAFALIGRLPDTLDDRSVTIELRRRTAGEAIAPFRLDRTEHLHTLARKAARWASDNIENLRSADPDVGDLFNRVADNWRPLLAIAELAGGAWPRRAHEAAGAAAKRGSESSIGIELLADIQGIYAEKRTDRLSSGDLAAELAKIEGRPWAEWGRPGKPISQNALARLLKRFKTNDDFPIAPTNTRIGDQVPKGYYLTQFEDAFARYLSSAPPTQPLHRNKPTATGTSTTFATATAKIDVAVGKCEKPNNDGHCDGVAVESPPSGVRACVKAKTDLNGGEGIPDFLRRCDHCGQPGRTVEPLSPYDWEGRQVLLHPRCEGPWFDSGCRIQAAG